MDVFDLRDRVVGEYASYVTSLFTIRDARIKAKVEQDLEAEDALLPELLVPLNPAFEPRESIYPECRRIFAINNEAGITRDDTEYTISTSPVLRVSEKRASGEYRTRRLVLGHYDALSAAASSAAMTIDTVRKEQ